MRAFADLLDRLSLTSSAKLTMVSDYLRATPDPDRGWALERDSFKWIPVEAPVTLECMRASLFIRFR